MSGAVSTGTVDTRLALCVHPEWAVDRNGEPQPRVTITAVRALLEIAFFSTTIIR